MFKEIKLKKKMFKEIKFNKKMFKYYFPEYLFIRIKAL